MIGEESPPLARSRLRLLTLLKLDRASFADVDDAGAGSHGGIGCERLAASNAGSAAAADNHLPDLHLLYLIRRLRRRRQMRRLLSATTTASLLLSSFSS